MHIIEVPVYYLHDPQDELYEETTLEVEFRFSSSFESGYQIVGYFFDGRPVEFEALIESNPKLENKINKAIDNYISNYEEEYIGWED
jgi:hypothetical protein